MNTVVCICFHQYRLFKQTDTECPPNTNPDCYCVQDDCFTEKFIILIDNCRLTVPINTIKYEQYRLDVMAYNNAMLTTSVTKEVITVYNRGYDNERLTCHFQQFFSNIIMVSFINVERPNTMRGPGWLNELGSWII